MLRYLKDSNIQKTARRAVGATRELHLVEVPVEAVLVVDDGGHEGQHKATAAANLRMTVTVLHVLPQDSCVLLVQAHSLLDLPRLTCHTKAPLP